MVLLQLFLCLGMGVLGFSLSFIEPDSHLGYFFSGYLTMGQILCLSQVLSAAAIVYLIAKKLNHPKKHSGGYLNFFSINENINIPTMTETNKIITFCFNVTTLTSAGPGQTPTSPHPLQIKRNLLLASYQFFLHSVDKGQFQ